jgi:hypothetical protein
MDVFYIRLVLLTSYSGPNVASLRRDGIKNCFLIGDEEAVSETRNPLALADEW